MNKTEDRERQVGWRLFEVAYIRDGDVTHTRQAVSLACLLHSHGEGRESEDFKVIQDMMDDPNKN